MMVAIVLTLMLMICLMIICLHDVDAHMVNALIYRNLLDMLLFCLGALVVVSLQVHSMY